MKTIRAIYEKGVFRPSEQVELPEHCEVEFEPRPVTPEKQIAESDLDELYKILSQRFDSGRTDLAERHNEHQP